MIFWVRLCGTDCLAIIVWSRERNVKNFCPHFGGRPRVCNVCTAFETPTPLCRGPGALQSHMFDRLFATQGVLLGTSLGVLREPSHIPVPSAEPPDRRGRPHLQVVEVLERAWVRFLVDRAHLAIDSFLWLVSSCMRMRCGSMASEQIGVLVSPCVRRPYARIPYAYIGLGSTVDANTTPRHPTLPNTTMGCGGFLLHSTI